MKKKESTRNLRKKHSEHLLASHNDKEKTSLKIAKDAMIKPVYLYAEDNARTIMKKLKREDTNVCVVITKDKKFIGEIGVEDLIKLFLHQVKYEPLVQVLNVGYKREFLYLTAKGLINKHKSTAKITDPINKVIKLIHKENFNCIPILNEKEEVVGVVTPSSLIDFLQNE